jgi:protein-S-isoprenylcysteine O-methyltransferase Ste14
MSGESSSAPDNPGVVAPPPLIYASTLAAGLFAKKGLFAKSPYVAAPFLPRAVARSLGTALIAGGALVGSAGFLAMHRAGTSVDPYRPSTAIVTDGPYRFTRNPLYVGMTLIYAGVAAFANALPAVLLLPAALFVMQRGVIEREERYLERKFGDEYLRYKARVRRWV